MAKNSKIEWTDHTFNPWCGCVKVSAACKYCYAESWARRVGLQLWGGKSTRRFFSDKHWNEPLKWNREAADADERRRVFCASMADVFEVRRELNVWRKRLWELIDETSSLDWLLLTKRPQNVKRYQPATGLPRNVWLGVTVETQRWADERIPILLEADATVRFLSCEPLLDKLDLTHWFNGGKIHWTIAGGESGAKARPTDPRWIQSLRDQCNNSGVAFHFKQWGHWAPHPPPNGKRTRRIDLDDDEPLSLWALTKRDAGRELDGRTWDELPSRT